MPEASWDGDAAGSSGGAGGRGEPAEDVVGFCCEEGELLWSRERIDASTGIMSIESGERPGGRLRSVGGIGGVSCCCCC